MIFSVMAKEPKGFSRRARFYCVHLFTVLSILPEAIMDEDLKQS